MRSFRLSGPSPAMVVACVALSLALAGSAVAGTEALNKAVTKSKVKKIAKKQGKKQANKVLNQRESSLNVNSANTANTATNATNAETAVVGAPRAYAGIAADGSLLPGYPNKGIAANQVINPQPGAYCFTLGFTPVTAAANAEAEAAEDGILSIQLVPGNFTDCPGSASAEVRFHDPSVPEDQNDSFQVQFDG
jgi:phage gpG-like protein